MGPNHSQKFENNLRGQGKFLVDLTWNDPIGKVYIDYVDKTASYRVHPTKYILYVNSAKYKIFKNHKKYLEVLQFLKPKEKILIDI